MKITSGISHLEVDRGSSSGHAEAEGRYVNTTVTFSKDEEIVLCEIWELGEETLQGSVIVFCHLREHMSETQRLFLRAKVTL